MRSTNHRTTECHASGKDTKLELQDMIECLLRDDDLWTAFQKARLNSKPMGEHEVHALLSKVLAEQNKHARNKFDENVDAGKRRMIRGDAEKSMKLRTSFVKLVDAATSVAALAAEKIQQKRPIAEHFKIKRPSSFYATTAQSKKKASEAGANFYQSNEEWADGLSPISRSFLSPTVIHGKKNNVAQGLDLWSMVGESEQSKQETIQRRRRSFTMKLDLRHWSKRVLSSPEPMQHTMKISRDVVSKQNIDQDLEPMIIGPVSSLYHLNGFSTTEKSSTNLLSEGSVRKLFNGKTRKHASWATNFSQEHVDDLLSISNTKHQSKGASSKEAADVSKQNEEWGIVPSSTFESTLVSSKQNHAGISEKRDFHTFLEQVGSYSKNDMQKVAGTRNRMNQHIKKKSKVVYLEEARKTLESKNVCDMKNLAQVKVQHQPQNPEWEPKSLPVDRSILSVAVSLGGVDCVNQGKRSVFNDGLPKQIHKTGASLKETVMKNVSSCNQSNIMHAPASKPFNLIAQEILKMIEYPDLRNAEFDCRFSSNYRSLSFLLQLNDKIKKIKTYDR